MPLHKSLATSHSFCLVSIFRALFFKPTGKIQNNEQFIELHSHSSKKAGGMLLQGIYVITHLKTGARHFLNGTPPWEIGVGGWAVVAAVTNPVAGSYWTLFCRAWQCVNLPLKVKRCERSNLYALSYSLNYCYSSCSIIILLEVLKSENWILLP